MRGCLRAVDPQTDRSTTSGTVKLGDVLAQGQQVGRRGLVILLGLVKVALEASLGISTGPSKSETESTDIIMYYVSHTMYLPTY